MSVRVVLALALVPATLFADASLPRSPAPASEEWVDRCVSALTATRDALEREGFPHAPVTVDNPRVRFRAAIDYGAVTAMVENESPLLVVADAPWTAGSDASTPPQRWFRNRGHRTGSLWIDSRSPGRDTDRLASALRGAIDKCLDDPPAHATLDGRYHVSGTVLHDGCAGRIVFGARDLDIDTAHGRMVADVVNRVYKARLDEGVLQADFAGPERGACAGGEMVEAWQMRRRKDGSLEGELRSLWPLSPDCARRCEVLFATHATRIDP